MALLRILLLTAKGAGAKPINPPAFSYFNVIGTVDLREQGGYFNSPTGQVALYVDAPPSQQGGYFNRQ